MTVLYVAQSKTIVQWGGDVGLGKNLFLVGLAEDADSAASFLAANPCGAEDWKIVKQQDCTLADETAMQEKLAVKEKRVDPALYPRLRGYGGLFKVKAENVENHMMIKKALEGFTEKAIKLKSADMASYLIHNATK